ncbi:MAG: hypothetical protein JWO78_1468 [Micavibrio sp.]|nr:hypothetical protein [Micavibrio sp.]
MKKNIPLFLALFCLAGCSALAPSRPPVTIYALHPSASQPSENPQGPHGVLRIETPVMPSGLDSDRIALFLADGRQLDYYAGAKWPAPLDHVLQDVIVEEARNAFPRMTIDTPDLNVAADYKISVRIREFTPVYQGGPGTIPFLKVSATFTLIRLPENTVINDLTLESGQAAASNSLTAVTAGLESLLQGMVKKALNQMETDLEPSAR